MNVYNVYLVMHYFYYYVKSRQNTRTMVCSNFIALLGLYMYTGLLQVQQTLEIFLKITFAFLGLTKIMLSRMFDMQY